MPTYQYVCTQCDTPLEAVQKFSDAALTECPTCSGKLRKVYSAVGVVFKGSGFYKNDSRAGAKKAGASSSSDSAKSPDSAKSSDGAKSESKSETKSDSKSDSKPSTPTKPAASSSSSGSSTSSS